MKSEEDQTADEPKQKVAQINSATNVMVFGYKYTFEKNFLKNVDGLQEENMDAQGNLMKRVDSENQVEQKMRLNQIPWKRLNYSFSCSLQNWREPRAFAWI